MPFALEVYFLPHESAQVRRRWAELKAAGVPCPLLETGARPHFSLGVANAGDSGRLAAGLASAGVPPPAVTLSGPRTFGGPDGVVFLEAVAAAELLSWHAAVWPVFAASVDRASPHYAPGSWVPHVTMSYGLAGVLVSRALAVLRSGHFPLVVTPAEIGCVDVTPDSVREHWRAPLNPGPP